MYNQKGCQSILKVAVFGVLTALLFGSLMGCSMNVNDNAGKPGTTDVKKGVILLSIQGAVKSPLRSISIIKSEVVSVDISLNKPDGSVFTTNWSAGQMPTISISDCAAGHYTITVIEHDTKGTATQSSADIDIETGYNYYVNITLGGNMVISTGGQSSSSSSSTNSGSGSIKDGSWYYYETQDAYGQMITPLFSTNYDGTFNYCTISHFTSDTWDMSYYFNSTISTNFSYPATIDEANRWVSSAVEGVYLNYATYNGSVNYHYAIAGDFLIFDQEYFELTNTSYPFEVTNIGGFYFWNLYQPEYSTKVARVVFKKW